MLTHGVDGREFLALRFLLLPFGVGFGWDGIPLSQLRLYCFGLTLTREFSLSQSQPTIGRQRLF